MTLTAGAMLQNRYRIVSPLGQGGMGAVYRAWDTRLGVPVALKELTPQPGLNATMLAQLRRQFQQEAAVLARLDHPHLVDVTDFFEEQGNTYLVMKFIEGESLADRIKREGALPEAQVLDWAAQLLEALAYCHSHGIIHRDVKPHNVIIRPDGQIALVDFGLVKLWDPRDPRTKTAMRGMGTPEYAPPEQYSAQHGHTDPRSDLYSLGATLYHALTGRSPLTATDRMADPDQFVSVRKLNARVSPQTESAVLQAMELPRGQRFQAAQEMAAALKGEVPSSAHVTPARRQRTKMLPSATSVASAQPRRVSVWVWVVGSVVGVVIVALLAASGGLRPGQKVAIAPTLVETSTSTAVPTAAPTPTPAPTPTGTPTLAPPSEPTIEPLRSTGAIYVRPADDMVMVYVSGITFKMGNDASDASADDDEFPRHSVTLEGFWIDQTEVTNTQFRRCVEAEACQAPTTCDQGEPTYSDTSKADHPVVCVNWQSAQAYCEWAGARLPTEAEWEYAARGPFGYVYPWGYSEPTCERAQFSECEGGTVSAGALTTGASWCNALDMAGNAWEWVADWYGEYPTEHETNPTGPSSGSFPVLRGGSWNRGADELRSANRSKQFPVVRYNDIGFRCAGDRQ